MQERLSVPPGPSSNTKIVIGLLISGLLILLIASYILYKKRTAPPPPPPPPIEEPEAHAPLIVAQQTRPLNLLTEPDAGKPPEESNKPGKQPGNKEREQGTIDARAVSSFINARFGQVKACYEHRLKTNSFLEGKLDLNIEINLQGKASGISINKDTVGDPEMVNCIKGVIRGWQFPKPVGGRVTIAKTFNFKKKN